MTRPGGDSRLAYVMAACWLAATVSLASWWLSLGLYSLPQRLHRMFIWEGAAFISLLLAGGMTILVAIRREHRRRQSLETFFLSFTHDLKTSLASVELQAEGLREDWPEGAGRTSLDRLLHDTVRLQIQLENSLFVAQPDGRLLSERVRTAAAIARLAEDWPELKVEVTGDADVTVDQRGFDAVVRNLLQNAVVHGSARRVAVDIEPLNTGPSTSLGAPRALPRGTLIRLTFADDGRGVPVDDFDELGQPFARAGNTAGSGMGLFVCRQLVTRMRGVLRFVQPDAARPGLTVVLELPGAR